ncbi:ESCO1/2 acetyl-transferase-domain-containing protein, partial [Entophlyctis helioformis]
QSRTQVQTTLQFGQKRPPASHRCSECGMAFVGGCDQDERLHRSFHKSFVSGIRWAFMDLIAVVDGELGAVARDTDQAGAQSRAGQQGFVCLSADDRVQGCVLAEPLSHAYTSLDDNKCSRDAVPAVVGISRIWVAPHARRKGIATRLLDAVRHRFVMGTELRREDVAFSQPSSAGGRLALRYLGPHFKVY